MPPRAKFPTAPIGNAATGGLLAAYFLLGLLSAQALGARVSPTALIWPASGVGLALVLLRGIGVWPLLFGAAAVRSLVMQEGDTLPEALWVALVNGATAALEPALAAWLIWRIAGEDFFKRAGSFALAMLIAAPLAALVATAPLIGGAVSAGIVAAESAGQWLAIWHVETLAELLGMLTLAPPIWIWARYGLARLTRRQILELIAWVSAAAIVLAIPEPAKPRYVLFGIHLAIAFRLPLQWSSAAVALSSFAYLWPGTVAWVDLPPPQLYGRLLTEVTFVILLNAGTYVVSLLHVEAREQAERRETLLHEREALLRELGQAEQRERRRLAGILHDHLQQLLVAIRWALGSAAVSRAQKLVDEAIEASRNLTVELHPPVLEEKGLAAAYVWLSSRFMDLHGVEVRVEADPAAEPPLEVRYFLFQVAHNLLMNVVKHAATDVAWLRLRQDNGALVIEVEDHGRGCDPERLKQPAGDEHKFGLFSIRQRVALLGGQVQVAAEGGCRVTVTVPISARP